jgi:hypothetical protein
LSKKIYLHHKKLPNLLDFTKSGHTVCYDGLRSTKEALKLKKKEKCFLEKEGTRKEKIRGSNESLGTMTKQCKVISSTCHFVYQGVKVSQ